MDINVEGVIRVLELLYKNTPGNRRRQFQSAVGAMAEPVMNDVYMRDERPPGTEWYSLEHRAGIDYRDPTFGENISGTKLLRRFFADHESAPFEVLSAVPGGSVPDLLTLATREWYDLKAARPAKGRVDLKWRYHSSHNRSLKNKRRQIKMFVPYLTGPILDGTNFSPNEFRDELLQIPDLDTVPLAALARFLNDEATPADIEKLRRASGPIARFASTAALRAAGFQLHFKLIKPAMLLWRLKEPNNPDRRWREIYAVRRMPATRPVTSPQISEHDRKIQLGIDNLDDYLLVALAIVLFIGFLKLLTTPVGWAFAVAIIAVIVFLGGVGGEDAAMASENAPKVFGRSIAGADPIKTLEASVGVGGANRIQDVHYVQTLLNGYLNRQGREGIWVTGRFDGATQTALASFIEAEFGDEQKVLLETNGLPLAILHGRYLEQVLCAGAIDDVDVFQLLKPDDDELLVWSLKLGMEKMFQALREVLPTSTPVEPEPPTDNEQRFGNIKQATRLLKEIRELTGDTSPFPTTSDEIYQRLGEKVDAHLALADTTLAAGGVARRTSWARHAWPDMSKAISCDWNYDTVVVHHAGNGWKDALDTPQKVENYHRESEGWEDIGYHFVIDKDAKVYEARSLVFKGRHVRGANSRKIGLLFAGDYVHQWYDPSDDDVTPEQIAAGRKLIRALKTRFTITSVVGHNDVVATECPGVLSEILNELDG